MRRPVFISVWICVLAVWMQLLAPAISLGMTGADGLPTVICSHASPTDAQSVDGAAKTDPAGVPQRHANGDCCPFCHHAFTALPTLDRPSFTRLDYPVSSPRRWARAVDPVVSQLVGARPPVRGPPRLV